MFFRLALSITLLASLAFNALALPTSPNPATQIFKRGPCDSCKTCDECYTCNYDANNKSQGYPAFACNDAKAGQTLDEAYVISRKQSFGTVGADSWDLAVAMQETGCRLAYLNDNDPDYPFGDWNDQKNARKTEDSACFGPFKMNWGQIRTKYQPYKDLNLQPSDFREYGEKINSDLQLAVDIIHALRGPAEDRSQFYQYHRGGEGSNPDQGAEYKAGIDYVTSEIDGKHDLTTGDGGRIDGKIASWLLRCI